MMTDVQAVLVSLLDEIDAACEEAKAPYSLTDYLAWNAVKYAGFHNTTYEAAICIEDRNYRRLVDVLGGRPGREVVEVGKLTSAYVHTGTTLIDAKRYAQCNVYGVAIVIRRLRRLSEGGLQCIAPSGEAVTVPGDYLDDASSVPFEGKTYSLSAKVDAFFGAVVGKEWRSMKWPFSVGGDNLGLVANLRIPYARFKAEAVERGLLSDELTKGWNDYYSWEKKVFKPAARKAAVSNEYLFLSEQRFRLWSMYSPKKDMLVAAWKSGRKAEVSAAFEEYVRQIDRIHKRLGITLCFDPDLLGLALQVMEYRDGEDHSHLLEDVPERHRTPVGELIDRARRG